MHRITIAALMASVALPAYAADLYSEYVPPSGEPSYSAPSMVNGDLSVGFGYYSFDYNINELSSLSEDDWLFEGAGRANIDLGGFNILVEVGGGAAGLGGPFGNSTTIGTAAHLWGGTGNAAFGIYGGVSWPSLPVTGGSTVYTAGAEAEAYFGPVTLGAAGDYNWVDTPFGNGEFWGARAWVDFYLAANTRIGVEAGYFRTQNFDIDTWGVTVDVEHRFAGTPFSLWAEGSYAEASTPIFSTDIDADSWSGLVGFRIFLDGHGTTLREHDRLVPWSVAPESKDLIGAL